MIKTQEKKTDTFLLIVKGNCLLGRGGVVHIILFDIAGILSCSSVVVILYFSESL